jgi:glycosyltransferase involved in cell wall biosynthesis
MHDVARRALEMRNYELIYSVNGIGVEHSTALELKRSTGLPWVAEFRDPWIHNRWEWHLIKDRSWHWWCARQFRRVRRMLREIVETADLVVVESPLHAEYLIRDFELDAQNVVALGMGFEPAYMRDMAEGLVAFPTRPVIGFVGQPYYGYQSAIKNLVDALKALELKGHHFTLVSVGSDTTFHKYADEAKLQSFVPIGSVDHSLALALTKALDFGIVAACEECLPNINSKLWEYLALNLSILAIAPQRGSMDAIIGEGDCGYVLPYDAESMLPVLETAFYDYENARHKRASSEFVQRYSRQTLIAGLVKKIEALI